MPLRRTLRPLSRLAASAAAVSLALALAACAPGVPDEPPSIVGRVESVQRVRRGDVVLTMLVRGPLREGSAFDAASVTVTSDTKLLAGDRESPETATDADVVQGGEVMVWFTGPVAESYPVQATAGTVLVLE